MNPLIKLGKKGNPLLSTFPLAGSYLVTGVLIGGQAISPENFRVLSDSKISVVAPNLAGNDQSVVVETTQALSNANITISIVPRS